MFTTQANTQASTRSHFPAHTPAGVRSSASAPRRWPQRLLVLALVVAAGAASAQTAARPVARAGVPPQALEQALKDLLNAQPELVRQALDALQQRDAAAQQRQAQRVLAESAQAMLSDTGTTVLGNPNGDVTLVEFIDYRCGYCKQVSASITALLRSDQGLRVLVKHLPVLGPESIDAARLAISAGQGQAAQALHAALMAAPSLDADSLRALAQPQGRSAVTLDKAAANRALGEVRQLADRLGIQGTPALVIGETLIRGAVDLAQLETLVRSTRLNRQTGSVAEAVYATNAGEAGKAPSIKLAANLAYPAAGKR